MGQVRQQYLWIGRVGGGKEPHQWSCFAATAQAVKPERKSSGEEYHDDHSRDAPRIHGATGARCQRHCRSWR